ncbi:MAG: multicopper oxidase domain-containing protein, partial [Acidimicrobiales bacterium]|nr:multicopper oxidase domain-containing protein [Acidimicrobiales bacterium]
MTTVIDAPRDLERTGSPPTAQAKRDNWLIVVATLAAFSLIGTIVAVGIAIADRDSGGGGGASGGAVTVEVELGDLYINPAAIEVPAGATVTFEVTNAGAMPHDFVVGELGATSMMDPGATETLVVEGIDSSMQAWCSVAGHREAGMEADITVTGGDAGAHDDHGATTGTETATGNFAEIDFNAAPGPDWVPFDPVLQPAPGGTNHEIALSMEETVLEVAPGVTQEIWTFNEQFPGPIMRGKVGDIFTVTLTNNGTMGHSLDFHASKVAMNDEMRTIQPGESLVYQFEAKYAGAFMYHCGTAPTLHHIGNGMHGALIIDPPDLAPVDKEFVFVQSEIYTGPEGEPGDLTKMQNEEWDAVVFNGYVNQYVHAPIETEVDERIRVWVIDNGPSENSSFHIVGTIFDTVFKEGTKLLEPDARQGGSQALDLQPAQGGYVEFTFDEPGMYVGVTHKFANVGKGAQIVF